MTKSVKMALVLCTLVFAAFLLSPAVASACTSNCVKVTGGGPFCRQCLDVGTYTGITCQNSGSCGCFFTQNTCGLSASGIQAQTGLAALTKADEGESCSAKSSASTLPAELTQ
jgi:hypothetical protein